MHLPSPVRLRVIAYSIAIGYLMPGCSSMVKKNGASEFVLHSDKHRHLRLVSLVNRAFHLALLGLLLASLRLVRPP